MKRLFWLGALVAILVAGEARAEVRRLVVVHTNDRHGHLFPGPDYLTPGEPKPQMGGMAAFAALVEAERERARASGAGFLVLDAGDFYHGSPEGDASHGRAIVEIMNLVGFDAVCIGNHEFAAGVDNVEALARAARFPLLAGNVWRVRRGDLGTDEDTWLRASIVKETGGLKVAVVAATTEAAPRMNRPGDTAGLRFEHAGTALRRLVATARGRADLVVALTHLGSEADLEIAARLEGCALLVGGHDHIVLDPARLVGETFVVQAGEHGRRAGRVTLDYDTDLRQVVRRDSVVVNLFPDAPVSATVGAAVEARRLREFDLPAGSAAEDIVRRFSGQSAAGGLVCEVIRQAVGADVAVVNQTMIRGGFRRGPVTRRDIYECAPFPNELVRIELKGAELRALVEDAVGRSGDAGVEVAGLEVRYDPARPSGARIVKIASAGAPLEASRVYRLATTDFFADRVAALARKKPTGTGITVFGAIAKWFEKHSPVAAPPGRGIVELVSRTKEGAERP